MSETDTAGRIEVFTGDITTLEVGAIVNAANEALRPGGGVCGAIHRAAGPGLAEDCAQIGGCPTGECRITRGHDLKAGHVVHCVGPVYHGGDQGEAAMLAACYRHALELARAHGINSVAFPAISTGVFGYPVAEAAKIAVDAVTADLAGHADPHRVIFACFDDQMAATYQRLLEGGGTR